ncbi:MAG: Ig-like domain-containing protein, partial [Chloroflexi bacterium]|nr:Ig-like domain-containing protein [Chloroflexota bacterium]
TIPPDNHKSFTEIEYDEALRRDMPRGLFLMDELTQEWTALGRDADDSKWSKLAKLRDRFATDYNPNYFDSPGDLGMKVAIALIPELEAEKRAAFADAASTLYAEPAKPRGSMKLIAQASTILGDGSEKSTITAFVTDPDANGIDDEPVLWSVIGPGYLDPITTQTKYGAASTVFTPIRSGLGAAYVYCWSLRLGLSASVRINLASARTPGVVPIA